MPKLPQRCPKNLDDDDDRARCVQMIKRREKIRKRTKETKKGTVKKPPHGGFEAVQKIFFIILKRFDFLFLEMYNF